MGIDFETKEACRILDAITSALALPSLYSRKSKDMAAKEIEWMLQLEDEGDHAVIRAYLALLRKE
jgi:hypothetical protein